MMIQTQQNHINDFFGDKRDQIVALAKQYHAVRVWVFGSVARGEAHDDSDVDFWVRFSSEYRLWDLIGLTQDLSALLGRDVDVVDEQAVKPQLRAHILSDLIEL